MGRRIRKITVVGVGVPPPLPLRPLVDEVLRAWDAKLRAQARPNEAEVWARVEVPEGSRRVGPSVGRPGVAPAR